MVHPYILTLLSSSTSLTHLPLIRKEKYKVGFNALWKELWTLPKRSEMLSVGVYVERRIW